MARAFPTERPEGCALVTGASKGIGAATAIALAADGWAVGVHYGRDAAGAQATVDAITEAGGRAFAVSGDVADPAAPDAILSAVEAELGTVLALINNAGITDDGLAMQLDDDAFDRVIATNLGGAFRLTRRALGPMVRARYGRVVNVASVVGLNANAGQSNYAASKAGLVGLTKTIAAEVARRGVTVNAVAPGFIATDMTTDIPEGQLGAIPARRPGTPDEVAACIAFLASDAAAYVTGSVLTVDGGLSA
ncbi:3-oxoacyl-[acyl-carrier-protein] reductase FabG [Paraconexibacter sp. AEG42_29]|uniref:3-oxoacyl-[acyl-carrier-protein] reductase FabG n=1 Tax=Paraconexibacter sp. AEG42_29 TaxID=2997339 RepID=A0AAU7B1H4_9ACTN